MFLSNLHSHVQLMKQLVLVIALFGFLSLNAQDAAKADVLFKLPSVTLTNLKGSKINSAELSNNGNPFVISFWATWCKPCIKELSAIAEEYENWQSETGMKLIAVSIDDSRSSSQVKTLVSGKGWDFEVLLDPNSDFRRAMNVNAVPHTFIVNAGGDVVWQHTGYSEGSELEIIAILKKIKATQPNLNQK